MANATGTLQLQYNYPVDIRENMSVTCEETSQTESILQMVNESTSNEALIVVQVGSTSEQITIAPNTAEPNTIVRNFKGSKLNVINVSTRPATVKVTLRNT